MNSHYPESLECSLQLAPMYVFYVALRLPVPGAHRQVYEIKAQCPINNLAAYCKNTDTQYNSYYLQQPDVYGHFKCTSLSSTCFHFDVGSKTKEGREKEHHLHPLSVSCH